jgi:hypothetical protein
VEDLRPTPLEQRLLVHLVQHRSGHVPAEAYLGDGPLIRALGVPWVTAQRTVTGLARKLASPSRPARRVGSPARALAHGQGAFGL